MRFTIAESMCAPDQYVPLALAAEEAGYSSFTIPDSICYPEVSDSKYPYTPDGNREFLDGKPFIEPMILAAALAAAKGDAQMAPGAVMRALAAVQTELAPTIGYDGADGYAPDAATAVDLFKNISSETKAAATAG